MRCLGPIVVGDAANDDLVVELTSETYEYFMRRTAMAGLSVLLEVYSDRCPHCLNFVPNYTRMAQQLKKSYPQDVIVARLDGAKQVVPRELDIRYYPSFFTISPAFDGPITFNGERSTEELFAFVQNVLRTAAAAAAANSEQR